MTTIAIASTDFALPWEAARQEDERFNRILRRLLLVFLLLSLVIPWLPLPRIEREVQKIVPPVMTKLILRQKLPAPPPPAPVRAPIKQPEVKTAPPRHRAAAPRRRAVSKMGVAAFSKQLQSLRSSLNVARLQARNTNIKTGAAARTTRSVLGREAATRTSGGVNTSVMNGNGGGTRLTGRSGVDVAGGMGDGGGGSGSGGGAAGDGGGRYGSTVAGGRDMESIRRVFERYKGTIYAIYNRALRSDPELRGKYVFHILIEPSGVISKITLISSELGDRKLEQKLLARIRGINFGPDDVLPTPVNYRFDFLPS